MIHFLECIGYGLSIDKPKLTKLAAELVPPLQIQMSSLSSKIHDKRKINKLDDIILVQHEIITTNVEKKIERMPIINRRQYFKLGIEKNKNALLQRED